MMNRVSATGEIVESPMRGRWMGNRGILHRGTAIVRPWQHRRWIVCETTWKDWRAPQWADGHYTVLFFHDEAVAFAAGHRPCALCRYERYTAFREAAGITGADALDRLLHAERRGCTHHRPWRELPGGTFVAGPALVLDDDTIVPWDAISGYGQPQPRPRRGDATVLTPRLTVDVLRAGYRPQISA